MKILADENIPYVKEAFRSLGNVQCLPGRKIDPAAVKSADCLLVRTTTPVGESLLQDSKVRFVASATSGFDHVDTAYLQANGIPFHYAPGSNAGSVAQYVVAAILHLCATHGRRPEDLRLGIVGHGHVGKRVEHAAQALEMTCLLNDPPLEEASAEHPYLPMEAIAECDFVTLHVPLTTQGPWPTRHMVDKSFLRKLNPDAVLINTARGPVVDNDALFKALKECRIKGSVLDVWEGEPQLSRDLLRVADIGTPHIAGYSMDGKMAGTLAIYKAMAEWLGQSPSWDPGTFVPNVSNREIDVTDEGLAGLCQALRGAYDIMADDTNLRKIEALGPADGAALFDELRKDYPVRREFNHFELRLDGRSESLGPKLQRLGFHIKK